MAVGAGARTSIGFGALCAAALTAATPAAAAAAAAAAVAVAAAAVGVAACGIGPHREDGGEARLHVRHKDVVEGKHVPAGA